METTVAQFEKNPTGRTWLPIELPELVSLPEFEAFAAGQKSEGRQTAQFAPYRSRSFSAAPGRFSAL